MRAVVVLFVIAGCASLRSKADDAYAQGNYLAAQELYDRVVAEHPEDRGARARRDDARNAMLRVLLYQADQLRAAHHNADAAAKLEELLRRRDDWTLVVDPRVVPQIAAAVERTGAWLEGLVADRARTAGPLAAEHVARTHAELLAHPDFKPVVHALADVVRRAGREKCDALVATTPYTSWVVARYCGYFGETREVPALPGLVGDVAITGGVAGETIVETEALRAALVHAFQHSVWFDRAAPRKATAVIDGQIAASFGSRPVTRVKTWTETVSYTDYETSEESYQEPYDDTETYTESVPSTEYQTNSVPCGDTTCTETTPVTVYHDETRTRTVTKYRTAYRTVTTPVTKYRDEEREFSYDAIERSGTYTSSLRVHVTGELPETIATIASSFVQRGDDHDVTNAAAGVAPERANLPTTEAFVAREQARLGVALTAELDARWSATYCARSTYTIEEAATCAYRDASQAPPAAHTALATLLGGDEPFVAPLLAR